MTSVVFEDAGALAHAAAEKILALARNKPDLLLCAATGTSPMQTYAHLARHHRQYPDTLARIRVVQLDEWLGLPRGGTSTCEHYLREHLVGPLAVPPERFASFPSDASDPEEACKRMQTWLAQNGPIDVCVLGLGLNGHVGLNEPANSLEPHCHVSALSEQTRRHAMLSGIPEPPTHGLTLGMADLLDARRILLLVSGASKREILERVRESDVTPQLPATLLKQPGNVSLLVDREAAAA
ncbi:MAG TPA: 6-phosphogluconolactonase [Rhodothermales bacterium]